MWGPSKRFWVGSVLTVLGLLVVFMSFVLKHEDLVGSTAGIAIWTTGAITLAVGVVVALPSPAAWRRYIRLRIF